MAESGCVWLSGYGNGIPKPLQFWHQNLFALRQPWLRGPLLEPMWWFRLDRVWIEK